MIIILEVLLIIEKEKEKKVEISYQMFSLKGKKMNEDKFEDIKVVIRSRNSKDRKYNGVSEWLLFNANSAIFQLYHGENKLIFNEMVMKFALY